MEEGYVFSSLKCSMLNIKTVLHVRCVSYHEAGQSPQPLSETDVILLGRLETKDGQVISSQAQQPHDPWFCPCRLIGSSVVAWVSFGNRQSMKLETMMSMTLHWGSQTLLTHTLAWHSLRDGDDLRNRSLQSKAMALGDWVEQPLFSSGWQTECFSSSLYLFFHPHSHLGHIITLCWVWHMASPMSLH